MYKNFIKFFLIALFAFTVFFSSVNIALADKTVNTGLETTGKSAGLDQGIGGKPVTETIGIIIGTILAFVGVLFLILMIYGGIVWMLARGNEQEITKAKNTINAAIFGIVIVIASYALTRFIFDVLLNKSS